MFVSFSTKGSLLTYAVFLFSFSLSPWLALESELLQSAVIFCKASVVNKVLECFHFFPAHTESCKAERNNKRAHAHSSFSPLSSKSDTCLCKRGRIEIDGKRERERGMVSFSPLVNVAVERWARGRVSGHCQFGSEFPLSQHFISGKSLPVTAAVNIAWLREKRWMNRVHRE